MGLSNSTPAPPTSPSALSGRTSMLPCRPLLRGPLLMRRLRRLLLMSPSSLLLPMRRFSRFLRRRLSLGLPLGLPLGFVRARRSLHRLPLFPSHFPPDQVPERPRGVLFRGVLGGCSTRAALVLCGFEFLKRAGEPRGVLHQADEVRGRAVGDDEADRAGELLAGFFVLANKSQLRINSPFYSGEIGR